MHPLNQLARNLRKNESDAERIMWSRIRNRQLAGIKFRRQIPIGNYIVDFVSTEKRLVIELDGGQHNEDMIQKYDNQRTKYLKDRGYAAIRVWNNEVLTNLEGVLEGIYLPLSLTLKKTNKEIL